MTDMDEGVGPGGSAQLRLHGGPIPCQTLESSATTLDAALALGRRDLARSVAHYAAELRALDAAEARRAVSADVELATRKALDAAAECGRVLRRLSSAPASGRAGAWAKAEALCVALAEVAWDEGALRDLGRSLADDLARLRLSERHPAGVA